MAALRGSPPRCLAPPGSGSIASSRATSCSSPRRLMRMSTCWAALSIWRSTGSGSAKGKVRAGGGSTPRHARKTTGSTSRARITKAHRPATSASQARSGRVRPSGVLRRRGRMARRQATERDRPGPPDGPDWDPHRLLFGMEGHLGRRAGHPERPRRDHRAAARYMTSLALRGGRRPRPSNRCRPAQARSAARRAGGHERRSAPRPQSRARYPGQCTSAAAPSPGSPPGRRAAGAALCCVSATCSPVQPNICVRPSIDAATGARARSPSGQPQASRSARVDLGDRRRISAGVLFAFATNACTSAVRKSGSGSSLVVAGELDEDSICSARPSRTIPGWSGFFRSVPQCLPHLRLRSAVRPGSSGGAWMNACSNIRRAASVSAVTPSPASSASPIS